MNVPHNNHAVTPVLTLLVHFIVSALLDFTLQVMGATVTDMTVGVQMPYLVHVHQTLTVTTSLQSVPK